MLLISSSFASNKIIPVSIIIPIVSVSSEVIGFGVMSEPIGDSDISLAEFELLKKLTKANCSYILKEKVIACDTGKYTMSPFYIDKALRIIDKPVVGGYFVTNDFFGLAEIDEKVD